MTIVLPDYRIANEPDFEKNKIISLTACNILFALKMAHQDRRSTTPSDMILEDQLLMMSARCTGQSTIMIRTLDGLNVRFKKMFTTFPLAETQ
jgi:hypothetical protein